MGITIYYKGKLKDLSNLDRLKDDLKDFAQIMDWKWDELDEDFDGPDDAHLEIEEGRAQIKGHLPLKGLSLRLHSDCESFSVYFDKEGNLTDPVMYVFKKEGRFDSENAYLSVKTQFAPPEIHIAIIQLLRFLKKRYIPNLEVIDEGGYWETSDKTELENRLQLINEGLDKLERLFSEISVEDEEPLTVEKLIKLIEEKLKKGFSS